MQHHLRLARPVRDLANSVRLYRDGLDLKVIGQFENHQGFDGVMLGRDGMDYHFEFTVCHNHPVTPTPSEDDLVVFYVPDADEWRQRCESMRAAGFVKIAAFNPYWDVHGATFVDPDGYRVVIQNANWRNHEPV